MNCSTSRMSRNDVAAAAAGGGVVDGEYQRVSSDILRCIDINDIVLVHNSSSDYKIVRTDECDLQTSFKDSINRYSIDNRKNVKNEFFGSNEYSDDIIGDDDNLDGGFDCDYYNDDSNTGEYGDNVDENKCGGSNEASDNDDDDDETDYPNYTNSTSKKRTKARVDVLDKVYANPKESLSSPVMSRTDFIHFMMCDLKDASKWSDVLNLVKALYDFIHKDTTIFTNKMKQKSNFYKNIKTAVYTFLIDNMENEIDKKSYKPPKYIKTILFSWCIEFYTKNKLSRGNKTFAVSKVRQLLSQIYNKPVTKRKLFNKPFYC